MNTPCSLIVCPEPLMRLGLRQFLLQQPGIEQCCETEDGSGAMQALARIQPVLAVVAAHRLGAAVPRMIRDLRRCAAGLRVLVVGHPADRTLVRRLFKAGALGLVSCMEDLQQLRAAFQTVLRGGMHVEPDATLEIMRSMRAPSHPVKSPATNTRIHALSDRELEVLNCIREGLGCKDAAHALGISVKTIETHKRRMMDKLGVNTSAELRRMALAV